MQSGGVVLDEEYVPPGKGGETAFEKYYALMPGRQLIGTDFAAWDRAAGVLHRSSLPSG
jgi:hypothetical protein